MSTLHLHLQHLASRSISVPFNGTYVDSGDNAWQLTASSLVALQSIPGLICIYSGGVRSKWSLNTAFMCLYAFASVLVCWVVYAFKMAFGTEMFPLVGKPAPVLSIDSLLHQAAIPEAGQHPNFPMSTLVYFQFVFAAITIVILAGGVLGRMNLKAWIIFVPLWLTFSYCVGAFSIWGGGFLFDLGVMDYCGGYVIHVSAGAAGFAAAACVGPRIKEDRYDQKPSNIPLMLTGAGILWIGWNGFNGGGPLAASADAAAAILNTNIATSCALLSASICDCLYYAKPTSIGAINGMISGLVAITPAAGLVAGWGAIIIGISAGCVPWLTMNVVAPKIWFFQYVDDSMGVFHTHMVAGMVGGILTGIFATKEGCEAFAITQPGGAIEGNGRQIGIQIAGALFIMTWNIVWTPLILFFIQYVLRVPLRSSVDVLIGGDEALHGERAYELDQRLPLLAFPSPTVVTEASYEMMPKPAKSASSMFMDLAPEIRPVYR